VKKLEEFKPGDTIRFEWVKEVGKLQEPLAMESRLRTFFFRSQRKIEIERRTDIGGWYLLTNDEQKEKVDTRIKRGSRERVRALHANAGVDRDKLTPVDKNRVDAQQRHLVAQLGSDAEYRREQKAIMGVPEPAPRLKSVKP